MTPYCLCLFRRPGNLRFTVLLGTILGVTVAWAIHGRENASFESLTKSGWQHFYSLEYDQALQDFEGALEGHPDDAAAVNHVLDAVLYSELYKYNALDTRLYVKQGFVNSKQIPMDPAAKKRIRTLAERALSLSDNRLKANPKDVQALYDRGITEGLRSTYLVLVDHSWFSALRSALAARHDHEQVLKLRPDWTDAKTIVGAHYFVVGSLTAPMKAMAGIAGIHGDKAKGLKMLAEAGDAGGETSTDARVALALFLRREGRNSDALEVVKTLTHEHPRNFLFALEEGNLMKESGRPADAANFIRELLNYCKQGKYPNAHVEMAYFSLGEAMRSQSQLEEALKAYESAAHLSNKNPDYGQRALLAAGEISDLLAKRQEALVEYRAAIAVDSSSEDANTARKYLGTPYTGR